MIFRRGLLEGEHLALHTGAATLAEALGDLGATLELIDAPAAADESAATAWVSARTGLTALVHDARRDFEALGLAPTLERAWICARAVATGGLIAGSGGRLVFIAPPVAEPLATAAQAGLENLARTLSTEWARHRVTATAICPTSTGYESELAAITGFLLSRAGGYFTGCRFDLGAAALAAAS
jgi:NAD(P)-dependent dehydrogenase (short-subunit alcohol dehydrogenase family)